MDRGRGTQPPTPPSMATTRTPPMVSMVTILLRPRGEPARFAPPSSPTTASGTAPPFRASASGSADIEGVPPPPPPAPEPTAPLVSAAAGAVDGEPPRCPPSSAAIRITNSPLLPHGEVRLAPPAPPPTPASRSITSPLLPHGGVRLPPLARSPTPASRSTTSPLRPHGEVATDSQLSPSDVPWSDLFPELLLRIAYFLRPNRHDVEKMRGVCPEWRAAVPSTLDPVLVLSKKEPSVQSEILLLEIARSDAVFKIKIPLSRPPADTSCWGSALGLLAMQSHHENPGEIFVYCIHCAAMKTLLPLPPGATPNGIFLEPLTPQRFLLMSIANNVESLLRVDGDGYPWSIDGGPRWLPTTGFGDMPIRSMALLPGVFRAGATRDSIIIIDESGRCLDSPAELVELYPPPAILSDGSVISPWEFNGQHLFVCDQQLYFTDIFESPEAPAGISARLFQVQKSNEGIYALLRMSSIGNFSLFLGANQSFVLPSEDPLIGRLSNTLYIEDYRGHVRQAHVLAINFESLDITVIPFPNEAAVAIDEFLPAVWAGLPRHKDIFNHCKGSGCWRFWD